LINIDELIGIPREVRQVPTKWSGIVAGVGIETKRTELSGNTGGRVEWFLRGTWKYGS
jgi:hypothetical protein